MASQLCEFYYCNLVYVSFNNDNNVYHNISPIIVCICLISYCFLGGSDSFLFVEISQKMS